MSYFNQKKMNQLKLIKISEEIKMKIEIENNVNELEAHLKERVLYLLKVLPVQPEIFMIDDESVQIEFGNVRNRYLEFVLYSDNTMDYFKKGNNPEETKEKRAIKYDKNFISKEVALFQIEGIS